MQRSTLLFTMVLFMGAAGQCWAGVRVDGLRCEYLKHPLGIDVPKPRLRWALQSDERGQKQTAYRVLVASTPEILAKGQGDLWDSGRVESDQTIHVEYAGKPLASRTRCHWKVRVWDKDGQPLPWSQPTLWTMGLLEAEDWRAQWIGVVAKRPEPAAEERVGGRVAEAASPPYAAVLLRKEAVLARAPVRATAYVCGLGYCELYINGNKVGDHVLDPGFTDYTQRVLYVTYDVTDLVRSNRNVIAAVLGGGWYDTPAADAWKFHLAPWIAPPKLLLNIDIEFPDGTHETIVSDASWKCSTGPIVFNSIRGGETYDARREKPGWDRPGYDDSGWLGVEIVPAPQGRLAAQLHPSIRITQRIRPVALREPKPGVYVFDLGVNIAGWAQLKTHGRRGQVITIEFDEALNPDGTVNMQHLAGSSGGRFQAEQFVLKGVGVEIYEPRFTYHGFRYVQVTGLSEKPSLDSLTGCWVHTDPEPASEFSCSHRLLNKIQEMILRTQLNNLHGIPTDCPQREKIGWTCDGCITMEEAICNFNMAGFYTKWFRDMLDAQDRNGHASSIAPSPGWGRSLPDGSPGMCSDPWWGGAIIRTPWQLYRYYGDKRVLAEGYAAMSKYMDYVANHAPNHIAWAVEGDWLEEGSVASVRTPPPLAGTAVYCYYAKTMSQIATILGKPDDAKKYADLAEAIRQSFNKQFFDPATGLYAKDSQTAQALPLYFGMVPEEKRALVAEQLLRNIKDVRKNHISSGIVGTFYVFQELMALGRDDVAYAMAAQEDYPGWGNMLRNGATSVWEAWNGDGSLNHPTLGCIGAWFYQGLGGIRLDPSAPGFKKFLIKPAVVGDLTWVKASYDSIHGKIISEWKREGGVYSLHVEIPTNTTATVYVPTKDAALVTESGKPAIQSTGVKFLRTEGGAAVFVIESGRYSFVSQ